MNAFMPLYTRFQLELMRAVGYCFDTTGRRFEPCTARQEHRDSRCSFIFARVEFWESASRNTEFHKGLTATLRPTILTLTNTGTAAVALASKIIMVEISVIPFVSWKIFVLLGVLVTLADSRVTFGFCSVQPNPHFIFRCGQHRSSSRFLSQFIPSSACILPSSPGVSARAEIKPQDLMRFIPP